MYLTKLFIIFGVMLIGTLSQIEGSRRSLTRTGENFGCAEGKQLYLATGSVPDENNINLVQGPRNCTERNHRRSSKLPKLKCGGNKCDEGVSNAELNVNSSDSEITQDNAKVPRTSRISRRMNCSGQKRTFNRISNRGAAVNVTHNEVPPSDNDEGQNFQRNRKCRGRFGNKGKCEKSELQNNHEINKDYNENMLNNSDSSTIEEPKPNIY